MDLEIKGTSKTERFHLAPLNLKAIDESFPLIFVLDVLTIDWKRSKWRIFAVTEDSPRTVWHLVLKDCREIG